MRAIYPFIVRHPRVVAAAPAGAEWYDVSDGSDAYWRLMCQLWADGDTFMVVEHDVICRPEIVADFATCPEPWCVHPYRSMCHWGCMEAWANMLGCTRYRAELIRALPHAIISIPEEQRDWHNLCDAIAGNKVGGNPAPLRPGSLRHAGFTHHWHALEDDWRLQGVAHISWEGHPRDADEEE